MNIIVYITITLAMICAIIWIAKLLGKTETGKEHAETAAKDMAEDADIAADAPVDRPIDKL